MEQPKLKNNKMAVFWVVAPCSLVEVYRRFRGACCLQHQGDDRQTTRRNNLENSIIILNLCVMLCFINQTYIQSFRQHNFVV
jgi:hypothetical protein